MKEDPPLDAKCRDKFLVQSVAITPERDLGSITAIVCMLLVFHLLSLKLKVVAKCGKHSQGSSGGAKDPSGVFAGRQHSGNPTQASQWHSKVLPNLINEALSLILR